MPALARGLSRGLADYLVVPGGSRPTQKGADPTATVVGLVAKKGVEIVNSGTFTLTLTAPIPVDESLVLTLGYIGSSTSSISSVTDSKGNTYRAGSNSQRAGLTWHGLYCAYVATALEVDDTITVTFATNVSYRTGTAHRVRGLVSDGAAQFASYVGSGTATNQTSTRDYTGNFVRYLDHTASYISSSGNIFTPADPTSTNELVGDRLGALLHMPTSDNESFTAGGTWNDGIVAKTTVNISWPIRVVDVPDPGGPNFTPDLYGTTYDDQIMGLGPTNYWKMNEASGSVVGDAVGGRDGATSGSGLLRTGPALIAGGLRSIAIDGQAYSTQGGVAVPDSLLPDVVTICGWASPSVLASGKPIWSARNVTTPNSPSVSVGNVSGFRWVVSSQPVGDGYAPIQDDWVPVVDSVYFLAVTCDRPNQLRRLYVNGRLALTTVGDIAQNSKLRFGQDAYVQNAAWVGRISHFAVFDRALTDNEILSTYRRGMGQT